MLKSELVRKVARRQKELNAADVSLVVNLILAEMGAALKAGRRIEIRDFGVLSIRHVQSRILRNMHTGKDYEVGPNVVIRFKPGKDLRDRIRGRISGRPFAVNAATVRRALPDVEPDEARAPL